MRHALDLALQEFVGAMVLVSHDRHLLRTVCDGFVLVADGRAVAFDGDLDDYRRWLMQRDVVSARDDERPDAERRQRLQPLKREVEHWEKAVTALETKKSALEQQLAAPAIYEAPQKEQLRMLLNEQIRIVQELATAEERWLGASEALEQAERDT